MKTVIYKCLGHFMLRIILLLFWSCKGLAQSSLPSTTPFTFSSEALSSSSSSDKTSSWTFTGEGYIAVYPLNLPNQNPDYKLSFRTKNRYGTLFCHILKDLKQLENSKLDNYEFCAEFSEGSLLISYHINNLVETVLVGKALNDDQWHSLELQLLTSGNLIMTLDSETQSEPLTSPAYFINWNKLSSVTLFGGKATESQHQPFIGCIKDIQIVNASGTYIPISEPVITGPVETGCQDKCITENPCQGGTPCTNHYSHAKCNCYGTGLQGDFCEQRGSTKITLRGYEWITYKLYDRPEDRKFSDHNIFSLQFKSDRGSGVLIYAVGSYPYECHVIASVHNGIVTASVGFHENTLEADLGIAVNDFRWHNLTIYHDKKTVTFILDKEVKVKTTDSSNYLLSLDPEIFFGGGDMFVITKGLQVTQNFIGCLKNVYVDDMSLVYEMKHGNEQVKHSGGHKPYFGCHKVENIPLSFPKSDTMIVLDTPSKDDLQVQFGFRTVRDTAIIFYARVVSLEDFGIGYFEIWIRDHQVILQMVPSTRNPDMSKEIVIDRVVNDNQWHTLQIHFKERTTYIKIDDLSNKVNHTGRLQIADQMVVGHGLRQVYGAHDGFVGCIRNLVIQNTPQDPIHLLRHRNSYGVKADGCHLVPHCNKGPHCEHGGRCLADWNGVSCDCSKTAYEGNACHFPKFRSSCDSYYQAGYRETGAYQIDLDGTGSQDPVYVWCVMGYLHGHEKYGMTKIDHNFVRETQIRAKGMYDMRKLITYREMTREILVKLTQKSSWCEQFIEYDCYSAPLRLGKSTIFQSASGEILELHYNTDIPGVTEADTLCSCRKRTCPEQKCKCDQGRAQWEKDSGYIRYKQQLPITEMRIMQTKSHVQKAGANLTLGPLKCWGEGSTRYDTSVTFKTTSSYLHLKPWKLDSLQFMFRTHEKTALLLHQTQSINNTNSVVIAIASETTVKFTIQVHDQTFEEVFVFGKIINDGEWHYVSMEMDKHNIRCIVDQQRIILNIPDNGVPKFDGSLYVGGFKDENVMPGLKGCMRGFSYNYKSEDLSRFAHPSIPGVIAGCRASCQSNPCLHGGECIEHWGTYNCICTNKWAHWGDSCERNINKDEITFDGTKDSYLDLEGFKEDNLLDSTIIFSFRTFESKAILLYIYDALNNFLQLELEKGDRLRLTFNHFRTVVSEYLVYKRYNDGEWKQIVIYQEENRESNFKFNYTKMFVNSPDNFVVVPYSRVHLHDYSSISPYNQEAVKPPRSKGRTNSLISEYYRIFVGGLPVNTSVIDNLSGCVRGLKIGNKVFSLQQEAHLRPGVANMCQEGCSPSPCEHKGICLERWGRNKFKCDCHKTNFAGDRCQIEASGEFTGSAVLEYNFELKRKAKRTTSEMLNLSFQTQILPTGKQVVLAVVMSSKHKDQDLLLFALTSIGVAVKHYQQHILHSLLIEGNFADGRSHRLQYWRSNGEMLLTLDDVSKAKTPNSQNALDDLDKIMLGGVIIEKLPSYIEKKQEFVNFTGCLSEVIFTPVTDEPYTFNPLKDLRSFTNDSIVVHGDEIKGCTIEGDKDIITTTGNTYTTTTEINADRTMPPWNPGPAETIYLNRPTTTTTTETPVVTTTTLVPTIPTLPKVNTTTLSTSATQRLNVTKTAIGHSNIGGTATELEIMVALGIIVGLMLIAVIIALVLCKKRKREKYVIEKKVPPDDLELKIPLNHTSSPPPSHRPYDHIARLDEFSMVSVTLGPKRRKENGIVPGSEPLLNGNDLSPGEYPVQSTFYNKKKNRPASSISEVLEEMERQKREKEIGENPEEEEEENKQKQDELEWDPMTDRIPLTSVPEFDSISEDFIYQMLPSPILSVMDDIEELSLESASTLGSLPSMKKPEDVDSEGDPLHVLEQQTDTLDANGDSGYEAESRKDGEEGNTPPTPEKMYMYDISGQNWSSTPNRKLVDYEESIT